MLVKAERGAKGPFSRPLRGQGAAVSRRKRPVKRTVPFPLNGESNHDDPGFPPYESPSLGRQGFGRRLFLGPRGFLRGGGGGKPDRQKHLPQDAGRRGETH